MGDWEISMGVLYSLAVIVGVLANICVCVVILKNAPMHTATNCYLFSLALSDLLMVVGDLIPWTLNWFDVYYGRGFCITHLMCSTFATYVTLLTVAAVSVTRYILICHPFVQYGIHDIWKTIEVIIIIWILGSVIALPQGYKYLDLCNRRGQPKVLVSDYYKVMTTLIYLIVFLIIVAVMGVLYYLIYRELKRSSNLAQPREIVQEENKKFTTILVTIVFTLFICWTPLQVCQLLTFYYSMDGTPADRIFVNNFTRIAEPITGLLFFFISAAINPLIYNLLSEQFREAFRKTFSLKRRNALYISANCTNEEVLSASKSSTKSDKF